MKKCKLEECNKMVDAYACETKCYCSPEHRRIGVRRGRIELAMARMRK